MGLRLLFKVIPFLLMSITLRAGQVTVNDSTELVTLGDSIRWEPVVIFVCGEPRDTVYMPCYSIPYIREEVIQKMARCGGGKKGSGGGKPKPPKK